MTEIKMTHEEMRNAVINAANAFYNGKTVPMNDLVYDEMLKMVQEDEPTFNIYDHIKYETDSIAAPHRVTFRDYFKEADIQNFTTKEEFDRYRENYYILPKFDGSSIVVEYDKNGNLDRILSRCDDESGFINTNKFRAESEKALSRIKVDTDKKIKFYLAECVCNINDGGRAQANGLVNSKYCQDAVDKYAHLMPFDIIFEDDTRSPNLYFEITDYDVFSKIRDTSVLSTEFGDIPCDGIVGYSRDLSDTTIDIHKIYFTEEAESVVTNISWEISYNTGIYHPVAEFETVVLDGTYVSRASLYNYQNVLDSGIRVGSKIKVIKANMTIPKIIWNEDKGHDSEGNIIPLVVRCDTCGAELVQLGNDLIDPNPLCSLWNYIIEYRMLGWFHEAEDDAAYAIVADFGMKDPSSIKCVLPDNWEDTFMTNISNFVQLLGVPRLGQAKLDKISADWNESHSDNYKFEFDEAIKFINDRVSWNMYYYIEIVAPIIKTIMARINGD